MFGKDRIKVYSKQLLFLKFTTCELKLPNIGEKMKKSWSILSEIVRNTEFWTRVLPMWSIVIAPVPKSIIPSVSPLFRPLVGPSLNISKTAH